ETYQDSVSGFRRVTNAANFRKPQAVIPSSSERSLIFKESNPDSPGTAVDFYDSGICYVRDREINAGPAHNCARGRIDTVVRKGNHLGKMPRDNPYGITYGLDGQSKDRHTNRAMAGEGLGHAGPGQDSARAWTMVAATFCAT